jgi:AraC-like DNA-binding protein
MLLESLKTKARNALLNSNAASAMHYFSRDVFCIKETSTSELNETMYEPALCVVLQGEKQTNIASRALRIAAGDSVIISHHVPVQAQITQASIAMPYLSLIIKLDPAILLSLNLEIDQINAKVPLAYAVDVEKTESALLETIDRYLSILADPIEAELIGPATFKELHLRVLRAPHGAMLRQMIPGNSAASSIARAIKHIRNHYRARMLASDIAREAGMSESSLYEKFREITGTTLLQYQKTLRLMEAQTLMSSHAYSVSAAAFAVGYESASHFSKDYLKKFGAPPKGSKASKRGMQQQH